jgi:hypothetical protein
MGWKIIAMSQKDLPRLQVVQRVIREIDFMFLWGYIATNPNHGSNYELQHLTLRFRVCAKEPAADQVDRQGVTSSNSLEFDNKVINPQWTTRCQMPMTPPR